MIHPVNADDLLSITMEYEKLYTQSTKSQDETVGFTSYKSMSNDEQEVVDYLSSQYPDLTDEEAVEVVNAIGKDEASDMGV